MARWHPHRRTCRMGLKLADIPQLKTHKLLVNDLRDVFRRSSTWANMDATLLFRVARKLPQVTKRLNPNSPAEMTNLTPISNPTRVAQFSQ